MIVHEYLNYYSGNLGNQLFKIAASVSLARTTGGQVGIHKQSIPETLLKFFDICEPIQFVDRLPSQRWCEDHPLKFKEDFYDQGNDCCINGYLQTSKYQRNVDVRSLFRLKNEFHETYKTLYKKYSNSTIIHIRKTDYRLHATLDICGPSYYQALLNTLENTACIMTDDPGWVAANLVLPASCSMLEPMSQIDAFLTMSVAKILYIANSSYSWWAAKWGQHDKIYAPNKWFSDTIIAESDVGEPDWIYLSC